MTQEEIDRYIKGHMNYIEIRFYKNENMAKYLLDEKYKSGQINHKIYENINKIIKNICTVNELSIIINRIILRKYKNIEKAVNKANEIREYYRNKGDIDFEDMRKCIDMKNKLKSGYIPTKSDVEYMLDSIFVQEAIDIRTFRMINILIQYCSEFSELFRILNNILFKKICIDMNEIK